MKSKKTKKADLESKKTTLFLIGLVVALGFILFAFEWKQPARKALIVQGSRDYMPPEYLVIPSTPPEKNEPEKPIIKVPVFKVIDDGEKPVDELIWEGEEPEEPVVIDLGEIMDYGKDEGEEELSAILDFAETMPEFPGGQAALLSFLSKNVKYPLIAQENGIKGKVFVAFVVDENGDIYDVTLARGVDASLDREALRVVKSMPQWKPGKQGNKAVKVRYTVPINFILQ
ncbi:protein TonB [Draconibacterium orientale]|uniref:Energy transducer TonB n=1 Tax=Draconibacterium orientale TaxID=1168034 RepID=X5DHM7_9BACT|nr:energy transducer TonB [Draconibacterium orientale]AHW59987.1 energy transducer TonB [Draconibacterium orientale]SET39140.1 protein TonB [Draconibacterium orientale]